MEKSREKINRRSVWKYKFANREWRRHNNRIRLGGKRCHFRFGYCNIDLSGFISLMIVEASRMAPLFEQVTPDPFILKQEKACKIMKETVEAPSLTRRQAVHKQKKTIRSIPSWCWKTAPHLVYLWYINMTEERQVSRLEMYFFFPASIFVKTKWVVLIDTLMIFMRKPTIFRLMRLP